MPKTNSFSPRTTLLAIATYLVFLNTTVLAELEPLFDGNSFEGWEGEIETVWRIQDGVIVGGSLDGNPRNEFLATRKSYKNFRLRLEYKLVGTEGFVNGGVQFRSQRIETPPNEMIGYQADIGASFSGSLYDESRRRSMLVTADAALIQRLERLEDWNTYEVVAVGPEIQLWLNGERTVTYVETDTSIEQDGVIALQIHGNNKAEISYRNLLIEELPAPNVPTEGVVLKRFGDAQPRNSLPPFPNAKFELAENDTVVFVGQENFVREQKTGELESLLSVAYAAEAPRFRSMAWEGDTVYEQWRDLNFGPWIGQLETAGADVVVVQFGQMEALDGKERITEFEAAYNRLLDQFAGQTRRILIVSPMPFEKPLAPNAPDLTLRNDDVSAYAGAARRVAAQRKAAFLDIYTPLSKRAPSAERLTKDGIHLNVTGLKIVAETIVEQLGLNLETEASREEIKTEIVRKNKIWFDCWRPANWSFAYGDRVSHAFGKPAGNEPSLKGSFEERRLLVESADTRIQALARNETVETIPFKKSVQAIDSPIALSAEEERATFTLMEGYEVNLFADETDGVTNPTQFAWDEKGQLYVACSPSYPQSMASEPQRDYIVVLRDTDGDGRADESHRFAEGLTMIQGIEPGPGGLYVCDFDQLLFLSDTDGDGRADKREVLFSGFGIGDTHQLVNSISHGPDGRLWFCQGLHAMSVIETPWGISRLDRSGLWRYTPRTMKLESFFSGGMAGANCYGVAVDDFGQVFHKSGDRPQGYWSLPGLVDNAATLNDSSRGAANLTYADSPEQYHSVGPLFDTSPKTTSLEIIGTDALPEEIQGHALIAGYFGSVVELHRFEDAGSGFKTTQLPRLLTSSTDSFRPVDVSVGPDGAMYLADWYNPVIGHYQASYADPRRDKTHGRIWRITAKGYPLAKQPNLGTLSTPELIEQLRSRERWTRYQAKRLLYYRPTEEVIDAADKWISGHSSQIYNYEQTLLEIAGLYQAHQTPRPNLLKQLLNATNFRVRAYGAQVLGDWNESLPEANELLQKALRDEQPRVRLSGVVAASYFKTPQATAMATLARNQLMDPFLEYALRQSVRATQNQWEGALAKKELNLDAPSQEQYLRNLLNEGDHVANPGAELYAQACAACHQQDGQGLTGVYPSLKNSDWVNGNPDRFIRIALQGLSGPLTLNGKRFESSGSIAMPGFAGLSDEEIADVLTYIRQNFDNDADKIMPTTVSKVRAETEGRTIPWTEVELLNTRHN